MHAFTLHAPTRVHLGSRALTKLPRIATSHGYSRLLALTGMGSCHENGALAQFEAACAKHSLAWSECSGIPSDPTTEHVSMVANVARAFGAEAIAPLGGGSVIDTAKAAAAVLSSKPLGQITPGDVWTLCEAGADVTKALPLLVGSTLAGSGSEANCEAVLTDPDSGETRSLRGPALFPLAAFVDPALQASLPWELTRRGVVDAFSHVLERYVPALFSKERRPSLPMKVAEALMRTLMQAGEVLHRAPQDLTARTDICISALQAQSGLLPATLSPGDWTCHVLAHAFKDGRHSPPAHGDLLAVLVPCWLEMLAREAPEAMERWSAKIFGQDEALSGVLSLRDILQEWGAAADYAALGVADDRLLHKVRHRAEAQALRHGGLGRALPMHERLAELLAMAR